MLGGSLTLFSCPKNFWLTALALLHNLWTGSNDVAKRGDMMAFHRNLLDELDTGVNKTEVAFYQETMQREEKQAYVHNRQTAQERQRRMEQSLQQQMDIKRKREEELVREQEELVDKFARKTSEDAVADAKARYLARKQSVKTRILPKLDDDR